MSTTAPSLEGTPFAGFRVITSYVQVDEALRSAASRPRGRPRISFIETGTVLKLSGEDHKRRRRLEGALFKPEALAHYERDIMTPAVERTIRELATQRADDGVVRGDIVTICDRMMMQVTGALIGLDGMENPSVTDDILEIQHQFLDGLRLEFHPEPEAAKQAALDAKERYSQRYVQPALARRQRLREEQGPKGLRNDLISVILEDIATGAHWDDDLVLRECIIYLIAAGTTTGTMTTHAAVELSSWLQQHPDDNQRVNNDDEYLRRFIDEAMRLHPVVPAIMREFPTGFSGTHVSVEPGETLYLDLEAANKDPSVFGPDADLFDPDRELPLNVARHGLAFGAGRHLCIGRPLAIGGHGTGTAGAMLLMLRSLVAAGARADPDRPPRQVETKDDRWESAPAIFGDL